MGEVVTLFGGKTAFGNLSKRLNEKRIPLHLLLLAYCLLLKQSVTFFLTFILDVCW